MDCRNVDSSPFFNDSTAITLLESLYRFHAFYGHFHRYLSLVLCLLGIAANCVHICVLTRKGMRKSPVHIVLRCIALADIGTMSSYLFFMEPHGYMFSWAYFLKFHAAFSIALHAISLYLVVFMAFIRFMALDAVHFRWMMPKLACAISIAIASAVFLMCVPTFLAHEISTEGTRTRISTLEPARFTIRFSQPFMENGCRWHKMNLWLTGIMLKAVPCVLLLTFTFALLKRLQENEGKRETLFKSPSDMSKHHRPSTVPERTNYMLLLMLIVFLLTEFPQGIFAILNALFTHEFHANSVYLYVADVLDLLSLINCYVCFSIYALTSSKYRETLLQMFSCRTSMDDYESQLVDGVRGTVDRLNVLWTQISMEPRMRQARTQLVFDHIHDLLEEIVTQEEAMVRSVSDDTEARRLAVDGYRRELSMTTFDDSIYQPGSIALLKALDKEHDRLVAKHAEVLSHQIEVHTKLKDLHLRLGSDAPFFEGVEEVILPATTRNELSRVCEQAEQWLNDRLEAVHKLQTNVKRLLVRLGSEGVTEEELGLCEQDFSAVGVIISDNAVRRLGQLQDKFESAWTKWQDDAKSQFDALRQRLQEAYEKCLVPGNERLPLDNFNAEDGAEFLRKMGRTLDALEQRHERAGKVFDKFVEWHTLWQEKEAPIDYNSRDLSKRINRMADLDTFVPRAMRELCVAVQEHIRQHPDVGEADLFVGRQRIDLHAQDILEQYNADKEEKRLAKARVEFNKKQPVGRKFGKPTDADRNLHQIRRTPMKKPRKPTAFGFDVSAIETAHFRNSTIAAPRPSSPRSSIGLPPLSATTTPRKLRKFAVRPSTRPAPPTTPRKPWK
ncbi:Protein DMSR-6 [Aphelenchoides avenae]|nr:Protein DMSR-6 [Aphelenchus avenae]